MSKRIISLSVLAVLLVSIMSLTLLARSVNAAGTIYIRADGSIDPTSAPILSSDMVTYTFSGDIHDSIVVERNNIVLDGACHSLIGAGGGNGIDLSGTNGVTIRNMEIRNFAWAIACNLGSSSSNNRIIDNTIISNGDGIVLYSSTNCLIQGNRIIGSTFQDGIWIWSCSNIRIMGNKIRGNKRGGIVIATGSEDNLISGNVICANAYAGIMFDWENNRIVHNDIMGNGIQAVSPWGVGYVNDWDDGYPNGGNYWGDYGGVDLYRGVNQDTLGSDGIGDSLYVIDTNNGDNYPFMVPQNMPLPPHNVVPEPTVWASAFLMSLAFATFWFMKGRKLTRTH